MVSEGRLELAITTRDNALLLAAIAPSSHDDCAALSPVEGTATLRVVASLDNLTVTTSEEDPNAVVAEGQIDSHTSPVLDRALTTRSADAAVSVDLSAVTFVDSSGLRVIVRAHKRQANGGGGLAIVKPSEAVSRLLDITGLASELQIES